MQTNKWTDWKWQLQNRITSLEELKQHVSLTQEEELSFDACKELFNFSVTPYYASLIELDNPACPIRKQVVPSHKELQRGEFETDDPLAEEKYMPVKGVTHRYPDRAIWYLSHICAVFCRFCTRKRKVGDSEETPNRQEWYEALNYFREHTEVKEVILSGGDPLSLSDNSICYLLEELKTIGHINHLRIHTRYPVTLPFRITEELCKRLSSFFPLFLVTHFNHAKEITPEAKDAIKRLVTIGHINVLNQTVLLAGINDSTEELLALNYALTASGVKPYYIHQCDEVYGSTHFRVPIQRGIKLMKSIRGRMSGLCTPMYVVDLTGGGGKVPVPLEYLQEVREKTYIFTNYKGDTYEIGS
jgi:lysine 2,3-aminomutase